MLPADTDRFIRRWAKRRPKLADPEGAWGMCATESHRLAGALPDGQVYYLRIRGLDYPGREHWALLAPTGVDPVEGGTVIDMTARQFNPTSSYPYVGDLDDWLDDMTEWLVEAGVTYSILADIQDEPVFTDVWFRDDLESGPIYLSWMA